MAKRKVVSQRVPRTRAGGEWTEAQYWQFIRGALRKAAQRYPPIVRLALEKVRRKNQSDNRRLKWQFQCAGCKLWYSRKLVIVDHIVPCGALTAYDHASGFIQRLFCDVDGLQVLCIDCDLNRTQPGRVDSGQEEISGSKASQQDGIEQGERRKEEVASRRKRRVL